MISHHSHPFHEQQEGARTAFKHTQVDRTSQRPQAHRWTEPPSALKHTELPSALEAEGLLDCPCKTLKGSPLEQPPCGTH